MTASLGKRILLKIKRARNEQGTSISLVPVKKFQEKSTPHHKKILFLKTVVPIGVFQIKSINLSTLKSLGNN